MPRLALPGWLVTIITGLAAYLKGALDQRDRDVKAGDAADAKAAQTAEQQRAEAEAADHEALQKDTDTWSRS